MTTKRHTPQARDFMNRHARCVPPDMPLADVVSFLLAHELSNVPVVEPTKDNGRPALVGFISERDCLEYLSNEAFYGTPATPQTARTVMSKHPVCVAPDTELFTLASIFVHHHYRHLPVVEGRRLVGIVSRRDILRALDEFYRRRIAEQDQERFPPDVHEIIHHRLLVSGRG